MAMFSVSNGYLGNLCMMMGPKTSNVSSVGVRSKHYIFISGHRGAGEDSQHDGRCPGPRDWYRLCPLLPRGQLALVKFTAVRNTSYFLFTFHTKNVRDWYSR